MIPLENWLALFGLFKNPFEAYEAGYEAAHDSNFLSVTFVPPTCFEEILGRPERLYSSLVFAPRGCGKSTTKAMLAHFCREGQFAGPTRPGLEVGSVVRILPVLHTHFSHLVEIVDNSERLVNTHLEEILHNALHELATWLISFPDIAERMQHVDIYMRLELQFLFYFFANDLDRQDISQVFNIIGRDLLRSNSNKIGFQERADKETGLNVQEQNDWLQFRKTNTHRQHLLRLASLLQRLGVGGIYVILDGLDEYDPAASSPQLAAAVIAPLLADLGLMNSSARIAFKVFAPAELETHLLDGSSKVRRDRLHVEHITWTEESLIEMLHRRLDECSHGAVKTMDVLAQPELHNGLEAQMTLRSYGNPRRLIMLGKSMFKTCTDRLSINDLDDESLDSRLSKTDLKSAIEYIDYYFPLQPLESEYRLQAALPSGRIPEDLQPVGIAAAEDDTVSTPSIKPLELESWPAPVARAYIRYEREAQPFRQLWLLYEFVECCLTFAALVNLAALAAAPGSRLNERLQGAGLRLEKTGIGAWRAALRNLPKMLAGAQTPFIRASQSLVDLQRDFLIEVNELRNQTAHQGAISDEASREKIKELHPKLQAFLPQIQFFTLVRLVRVENMVKNDREYRHICRSYTGPVPIYPAKEVKWFEPLDSNCLWLLEIGQRPLALSPWILYTPAPTGGEECIWFYNTLMREKGTGLYKNFASEETRTFTHAYSALASAVQPY